MFVYVILLMLEQLIIVSMIRFCVCSLLSLSCFVSDLLSVSVFCVFCVFSLFDATFVVNKRIYNTTLHPSAFFKDNLTWVSRHRQGKPFWILLEQEIMGWQWHQLGCTICKSFASRCRQITTPVPHHQGCTQEGADRAKAPPEIPRTKYLLIQIRSILCFAVCTKKSVSQLFYNNRLYRLRC